MNTEDIPVAAPSEWQPITDPATIAVLGKLNEELAELIAATSRCLIQGIWAAEPTSGKVNHDWLTEELADVAAMMRILFEKVGIDELALQTRAERKYAFKLKWIEALEGQRP